MNNRSGVVKDYKQNFLLEEPKLRKIVDIIKEQSKKLPYETYIEFYVELGDDIFYTTQQLDEVLQNDNTEKKSIRLLTIRLYKSEPDLKEAPKAQSERKPIIYVVFAPLQGYKVSLSVACELRDWTFLTADELDTQIQRVLKKRNNSLLQYADIVLAFLILYIGTFIMIYLLNINTSISNLDITSMTSNEQISKILEILIKRNTSPTYFVFFPLVISWSLSFYLAISRPISNLISKSRTSFFYWGDMIQIHDKIEQRNNLLKWSVVIGLVISIVGSIIGSLIIS